MRWLADENIPGSATTYLRARSEDVESVAETCPGIADPDVIELARGTGRILLTFDRDHGDLIFAHAVTPPPGVVYLRLYPPDPEALLDVLAGLITLGESALLGYFTVVTHLGVRQRPLPSNASISDD